MGIPVVRQTSVKAGNDYISAYAVNGTIIEPWTLSIERVANMLGEQGWELIAAYPEVSLNAINFIFKRPKY
jgi:hypothetical protein